MTTTYSLGKVKRTWTSWFKKPCYKVIVHCSDYPDKPFPLVIENVPSKRVALKDIEEWFSVNLGIKIFLSKYE